MADYQKQNTIGETVEEIPMGQGDDVSYGEIFRSWFHNHMRLTSTGMDSQARRLFDDTVSLFSPIWDLNFITRMNNVEDLVKARKVAMTKTDRDDAIFRLRLAFFMDLMSSAGIMKKPDIILDIHPEWEVPIGAADVCNVEFGDD